MDDIKENEKEILDRKLRKAFMNGYNYRDIYSNNVNNKNNDILCEKIMINDEDKKLEEVIKLRIAFVDGYNYHKFGSINPEDEAKILYPNNRIITREIQGSDEINWRVINGNIECQSKRSNYFWYGVGICSGYIIVTGKNKIDYMKTEADYLKDVRISKEHCRIWLDLLENPTELVNIDSFNNGEKEENEYK